jgi:hypothetical protein
MSSPVRLQPEGPGRHCPDRLRGVDLRKVVQLFCFAVWISKVDDSVYHVPLPRACTGARPYIGLSALIGAAGRFEGQPLARTPGRLHAQAEPHRQPQSRTTAPTMDYSTYCWPSPPGGSGKGPGGIPPPHKGGQTKQFDEALKIIMISLLLLARQGLPVEGEEEGTACHSQGKRRKGRTAKRRRRRCSPEALETQPIQWWLYMHSKRCPRLNWNKQGRKGRLLIAMA